MAGLISLIVDVFTWLIIVYVLFSFFLSPYHSLREKIDRIVDPMLAPFRRYIPPIGGVDFSPLFFILTVQIIGSLLARLLS